MKTPHFFKTSARFQILRVMEEISPDENRTIQVMEEKESASEEIPQASLQKESFTESSSLEIILLETPVHEDKVPRDELLELKTCEVKLSEAECLTAKPPEFGNSSETNKEFEKKVSTETPKIEEKKTPFSGREKKVRRRSSIGSVIANAFITPGTEDTMSPLEEPKRPIRPRRSVQIRQITPAPTVPRTVLQQIQPQRYSFDLGECVPIKSCLKQEKREVPIRAGTIPAQKSLTQRTANKVKNKYRKSRSFTELITPTRRRSQKLQFHRTCSIRVITPRPDYDPEAVSMPLSDDESEGLDPNRERLSTTELELTPNSQSQLAEIQNKKLFNSTQK
uniref:Shugoshin_C domain-containing protein n=1 Tax=Caenorhabditis tropicalis TaxID=1561998 RepID=A0A1I7UUM5_9PELO